MSLNVGSPIHGHVLLVGQLTYMHIHLIEPYPAYNHISNVVK